MKTWKLILGAFIATMAIVGQAKAYTINDNYWGGTVVPSAYASSYGDTIGYPNFSIDGMNITKSGNNWSVTITGQYFKDHESVSADSGFPYRLLPGDLYINSNGWNVDSSDTGQIVPATAGNNYSNDTFSATEGWNYVVSNGANGWGLYSLNPSTITTTNVTTSPALPSGTYIYRQDQAWQGGAGTLIAGGASYNHTPGDSYSTFTFNTGNFDFSGDVGFHWTMQCGNDVIEGKVPAVPEPATLLLLGLGLVGIGVSSRKLRK